MVFGFNKRNRYLNFTLDGTNAGIVENYEYLGIFCTPNGRYVRTHLITQTRKVMCLLY